MMTLNITKKQHFLNESADFLSFQLNNLSLCLLWFTLVENVFPREIIPNKTNKSFKHKRHNEHPEYFVSPEGELEDVANFYFCDIHTHRGFKDYFT